MTRRPLWLVATVSVIACGSEPPTAPALAGPVETAPAVESPPVVGPEVSPPADSAPDIQPCEAIGDPMDDVVRGRLRIGAELEHVSGAGEIDEVAVLRMINSRRAAMARPFDGELRCDPRFAGSVRVTFTIDEAGHVSAVDGVADPPSVGLVVPTLERVFRGLRFPAPAVGGPVEYAITLTYELPW